MTTSETATMPERGTTRYRVLVGALLIQLILGTIYGYSIFWEPLESTLWPPVLTTEQVTALRAQGTTVPASAEVVPDQEAARAVHANRQSRLKYSFAICLMAFAVTMIPAGRLQDVIGPRKTALIGAALLGVAYLTASRITHLSRGLEGRIALLWVSIGLIAGVGVGFAYVCPIAALVKWFPRHKGLVSGLAVAGFGFGAYIFSQKSMIGATGYIRVHSVEAFFLVHALVCTVTVAIGALLLRNPPAASTSTGPASAGNAALALTGSYFAAFAMAAALCFLSAILAILLLGVHRPAVAEK